WGVAMLVAVGAMFLVRFTALLLGPMFVILAVLGGVWHRWRRPRRLWIGLVLLLVAVPIALAIGYKFGVSFAPLSTWPFESRPFRALAHAAPWLRLPLPDLYIGGLDRQLVESGAGVTPTYLFGAVRHDCPWYYFPVALAAKWPLAFL